MTLTRRQFQGLVVASLGGLPRGAAAGADCPEPEDPAAAWSATVRGACLTPGAVCDILPPVRLLSWLISSAAPFPVVSRVRFEVPNGEVRLEISELRARHAALEGLGASGAVLVLARRGDAAEERIALRSRALVLVLE